MREQGQDRPAQGADVARGALEAEMVRNHRFFHKTFNEPGHVREQGQDKAAQDPDVARAALEGEMVHIDSSINIQEGRDTCQNEARTRPQSNERSLNPSRCRP